MGCIISKIRKCLRKCFGCRITPKLDSLMEEYRKISTPAKNLLSSFIERLREDQSSADLLEEAVNRFRNDEPNTSVLESLQNFKANCNTSYLHENHFDSSCEWEDRCNTYTDKFSGVKNVLDEDLKMVERWNIVAQWVLFVVSLGLKITSAVLSFMGDHPMVAAVFGGVPIDSLESKISNLCFEKRKNSLKSKRDTVDLLIIAIDKHRRIKELMQQTSRDIKKINDFKARVHKLVDVYISNFADHGNDDEAAKLAAMDRIETENRYLQTRLQDLLRNVEGCLEDLNTATENIQRLKK